MAGETVSYGILGPIEVVVDDRRVAIPGGKARTLLAVLLLAEGRTVPDAQLVAELWADRPPPTATTALQVHVSHLRRGVGDRLRRTGDGYQLATDPSEVDASRFVAILAAAKAQLTVRPAEAVQQITAALGLWRGEALSGADDAPAVVAGRLRLDEQRMAAIELRAGAQLGLGQHADILADLLGLVTAHPTRERLTAHLMVALYRCGRDSEAAQIYRAHTHSLDDRLGAAPSEEMIALAAAIARHDPTLSAPSALPIPGTRFVGRRHELDELEALLGSNRMLTLVGAGGTGKTRLALQLTRDIGATAHPDGVHLVELAGSEEADSVLTRLAASVEVRELPGESLIESVVARLRSARALVILDNCEHLARAAQAVAAVLLARCSAVRILATSRESLGVDGEHLVFIGGLALPEATDPFEVASGADAIRLLAARGAAARTGFRVDRANISAAIAVCRRLDGLPLAIELAASRLRVMSLAEIESRLDHQLDLLSGVSRSAIERHRTIRATIDWGYNLLEKDERVLFTRLGVFVGGFTLAAAEQVAPDPNSDPADTDAAVLDTLGRLVDRSMLVPGHIGAHTRFKMLEPIHQYAAERLQDSDGRDSIRDRHASWCRRLIETAPQFGGDDHADWMARIGAELDNFRAALEWTLSRDPVGDDALGIATALWWYWWASGQMREGKSWLLRALQTTPSPPDALRAAGLRAAAALARNSGDLAEARELGERALSAQQSLGDAKGLAMAWNNLCMTATGQRDFDAALFYIQQSQAQAQLVGDPRGLAVAANNSGTVLRCLGRLAEAAARFTEAAEGFAGVGDVRGEAAAVGNLGVVARHRGDLVLARTLGLGSLRRYRDLDLVEGELDALEALACIEVRQSRPAAGLRLLLLADRERRRLGAPIFVPDESDDRDAALQLASNALGPARAHAVSDQVGSLQLATAVAELLL